MSATFSADERRAPGDELAIETDSLVKRFPVHTGWRGLVRRGGEELVLDHITLAVRRGEIFGLLGPNGAGKTTLCKILCTLTTPTSGQARVAGFDVVRQEAEVRRRIGLLYGDQRSFFWRLSVWENLLFYAALYQMPAQAARRRIIELLEAVGLQDAAHVRMHHFSSGMKQRAAIARGLLSDPDILLLDEPTTAVDPLAAFQIRHMIRDLVAQDGRRTILLMTNMMDEAELLCDRLALLNHGRIEMMGTVATLRDRFQPDDRFVLTLGAASEAVLQRVRAVPTVHRADVRPLPTGQLELAVSAQRHSPAIPEVLRVLVAASVDVWSCSKQDLTLEEMFRLSFGAATEPPSPLPAAPSAVALSRP
jgi:ABC-2 type transport system ATP-binding protein